MIGRNTKDLCRKNVAAVEKQKKKKEKRMIWNFKK